MIHPLLACRLFPYARWALPALLAAARLVAQTKSNGAETEIDALFQKQGQPLLERTDPLHNVSTISSSFYFLHPKPEQNIAFVFPPPAFPRLLDPLRLRSPLETGIQPPAELAAYVADLFYPLLAARLASGDLPRNLRHRLDSYREARAALLDELQSLLARHSDSAPADRHAALAACALAQATRLQKLESDEECIRTELAGPDNPLRFEVGAEPPASPLAETALMRGATYFLDGLTGAQRRLLRTVADECGSRTGPDPASGTIFFAPEGASIHVPNSTDPTVRSEIESFVAARRTLALALLDTIRSPACNPGRLRELAARQAPELVALEARAETIRLALGPLLDDSSPAASPPLPPGLTERFAAYRERKKELYRELHATIVSAAHSASTNRCAADPSRAQPAPFTPEQQARIAALNTEKNLLRSALAEHRRKSGDTADRKTIDTLIEGFERARQRQELREKYRDYRIALLEPGLAPAQRRLLFGAALRALDIPLPFGEPLRRP